MIAIRAALPKRRKLTCKAPASLTLRSSARKRSFSSSTTFASATARIRHFIRSIAPRAIGTAHARSFQILVTKFGRKRVISRFRRWTRCKTSAMRWHWNWRKPASRSINSIMKHAPALTCITNPTTNSFKRLVPGFEAPVNLAYSARNRSAAIRIPTYSASPKAKRIEFRTPDSAANPYLAFSAMLLAGLDGIQSRIDPGDPLDKNLYDLPPEELAQVASVPDSLRGAIEALQADHAFLLRGDVFNEDFIANWIDMKQKEYDALRLRPHPYEFAMYYDV